MCIINLNTQRNVKVTLFPDNQTHVTIDIDVVDLNSTVDVICSITDSLKMMQLLQVSNALDHRFCKKRALFIPYLLGARSDRVMLDGDSADLQVYAQLINSMNFERVYLYDPHSEVALMLINNSLAFTNRNLVELYDKPDAIFICPDTGAAKKADKYTEWTDGKIVDSIQCLKVRDFHNKGAITLKVLEPEKCENRNVVIIDDLCDGGGTFIQISNQIRPKHSTLIVTHSIFSRGASVLADKFDHIITSDSYCHIWGGEKITQIKHPLDGSIFKTR